ncbi:MAG TPA: 16S rRNA processing protein RimM [Ruminococcaceae bacterium]|nr:16S rRNA processing protein RimM [Oscillospiraceae bacterium]
MQKKYIETGRVVGTHGIAGELRVQPWSDTPEFLLGFSSFFLDSQGLTKIETVSSRVHGNIVLMKVKDVGSIEAAERLRGKILYLNRRDITLEPGAHFIQDLIGLPVFHAETGERLGEISDVSKTGANDVWHIAKDASVWLIPVIPDVVRSVDVEGGRVEIIPLRGIFDDED